MILKKCLKVYALIDSVMEIFYSLKMRDECKGQGADDDFCKKHRRLE